MGRRIVIEALTGTLSVLDEPTIGLHPRDNQLLIAARRSLTERGNSRAWPSPSNPW